MIEPDGTDTDGKRGYNGGWYSGGGSGFGYLARGSIHGDGDGDGGPWGNGDRAANDGESPEES